MSTNIAIPTKTGLRKTLDNFDFIVKSYKKWKYGNETYCKYGLMHDDLFRDGHEDVAEAVRRLPSDLRNDRLLRCHRAMQFSRMKIYMPEAMWTKMDDRNHFYLKPYLDEVMKEKAEKAAWDKK